RSRPRRMPAISSSTKRGRAEPCAPAAPATPTAKIAAGSARSNTGRRLTPCELPARLHPGLGPRQARARGLPVAARLGPGLPGREAAVPLDLRGARREERAEDADRPVVEARRRVENEGLDAVVPGQPDSVGRGINSLNRGRARIS